MVHSMYVAELFPLPVALLGAFRAYTLGHKVYGLYVETVRIVYCRYGQFLKAECAVAHFTVKMNVAVIIHIAVGMAQLVAYTFTAVIDLVQQMVLLEKGQSTEYSRLVDGVNGILKFGHSNGAVAVGQRLQDQQPISRRLDPVLR